MDVTKKSSKYSFVFCNPLYSDCSLNLYTNGSVDDGCGPRAVPASSAILAANSGFFKKMLSGNFKESSNKTSIDIHLEAQSDVCFMNLLRFMHSETLPCEAKSSLQRVTELLILADRFKVEDCVVACARELKSQLPITSPQDALLILALPQSLREDLRLKDFFDAANLFLVIHSSVAMHQATTESLKLIRVLHPTLINERGEAVNQEVHQAVHQEVHRAVHKSFHRTICPEVLQAIHQGLDQALHPAEDPTVHRAVHQAVDQAIHQGLDQGLHLAVHPAVHPALHQAVQRAVHKAMHRASEAVYSEGYLLVMAQLYTRQARRELLDYSEAAMEVVLESKMLGGDSEDSVVNAALAWAMHRSSSPEDVLDTLFSFVLPRLCLRSLSPSLLQGLLLLLIKSCCNSQCHSGAKQLAATLSGGVVDDADPPLSPGMAPSTPTRAAASDSEPLYSPGTSVRASRSVLRTDDGAARATSRGVGDGHDPSPVVGAGHATSPGVVAGHATSPGVGASGPHDLLMDPLFGREETSNEASGDGEHQAGRRGLQPREGNPSFPGVRVARACHPSCSAFLARGRDVLPLCVTMCEGATAHPEAVAAALGVFADALVDLSEQNFVHTGALAKGRSFRTQQTQDPLLLPPRAATLPSGCLSLDVRWRFAGARLADVSYHASNHNTSDAGGGNLRTHKTLVVRTPDIFASGRWLKLSVYLNNSSSPRLEVHLEKSTAMRSIGQPALEAGTKWRFCLQTSSSQPAFESFASGTLSNQEQSTCVGSIPLHENESIVYFCQDMLRMRVDTWCA